MYKRQLLNHLVKFLGAFKARVELGEMVRQAEEQGVFTLPDVYKRQHEMPVNHLRQKVVTLGNLRFFRVCLMKEACLIFWGLHAICCLLYTSRCV